MVLVPVTNMRYGCHNQLIVTYDTHAECEDGILAEFATDWADEEVTVHNSESDMLISWHISRQRSPIHILEGGTKKRR